MTPEYTAWSKSPHAKVRCVECHIGPGAKWYVKAKISGLKQIYAVLAHTYSIPIETPITNLRPARDICERCHWPEKFYRDARRYFITMRPMRRTRPGNQHADQYRRHAENSHCHGHPLAYRQRGVLHRPG